MALPLSLIFYTVRAEKPLLKRRMTEPAGLVGFGGFEGDLTRLPACALDRLDGLACCTNEALGSR